MFKSGKCGGCGNVVQTVSMETIEGQVGIGGERYNLVSYLCPSCRNILGVQMDPIALKTDTINGLKKALGR